MTDTKYILAIDQGTTNTKACLVDRASRVVASSSVPVPVSFPRRAASSTPAAIRSRAASAAASPASTT